MKRKLLIGLLSVALVAAAFGVAVVPASAQLRSVTVTLLDGRQLNVVLDLPPGAPLSAIKIPGVDQPIVSIVENPAPPSSSAPGPALTTKPAPTPPPTGPATNVPGTPQALAQRERRQRTTGHKRRNAKPKVKGKSRKPGATPGARSSLGVPTPANPTFSFALPNAAPIGVPDFFIQKFRVPLFLLPIYQAAATEYGVPWQVLAAINEIETDYGRDMAVSSAGAQGWMQFLPATWKQYGVDANQDGKKDPYEPSDAIFAAARYLKAAGAQKNLRSAIFAYNHANWYVDSVMLRAQVIGGLPDRLVGSLTGLAQGHFPVHARARYADDPADAAKAAGAKGATAARRAALAPRDGVNIYARSGAPVVAVQDGKIVGLGDSKRIGLYVRLRDSLGNTYTYGHLKKLVDRYPVPKPRQVTQAQVARELHLAPAQDPPPTQPASAGHQPAQPVAPTPSAPAEPPVAAVHVAKERLFANPQRPDAYAAGGKAQIDQQGQPLPAADSLSSYFTQVFGLRRSDVQLKPLVKGSMVIAGTILGRIGAVAPHEAPHVLFQLRPAGRGTPLIDPKPVLDGWKLLEATAIYRAAGKNPFLGPDAKNPTLGQIFLMSKETLQQRVLTDPSVSIYDCGRRDIESGQVDRRVLATLEFLSLSGMKPTVSALRCGHSVLTSSGYVSEHSSGNAVDIAQVNGIPILGHQGPGTITDAVIRRLLTLQGLYKPHQIISLMTYPGTDNTLSLPDHANHVHIGFQPLYSDDPKLAAQINSVLKPKQWIKLIDRLRQIKNPVVSVTPSAASIPAGSAAGD